MLLFICAVLNAHFVEIAGLKLLLFMDYEFAFSTQNNHDRLCVLNKTEYTPVQWIVYVMLVIT